MGNTLFDSLVMPVPTNTRPVFFTTQVLGTLTSLLDAFLCGAVP
mgnify:CR=1 FL=1